MTAAPAHHPRRVVSGAVVADSIAVLVVLAAVVERVVVAPRTSDDVAWQVALRTWRPFAGELALTENTYVLHVPVLVAIDRLLPASTAALALGAGVLAAAGVLLVTRFVRFTLAHSLGLGLGDLTGRHHAIAACAATWPLVGSEAMRTTLAGTTSRQLEIGLGLALGQFALELLAADRPPPRLHRAVAAACVGVVVLNDPLLAASVVVPGLALVATIAVRRRGLPPAHRALAEIGAAGLAAWLAVRALIHAAGVRQHGTGASPALAGIRDRLGVWWEALLRLVGASTVEPWTAGSVVLAGLSPALIVWALATVARDPARARPMWLALGWFGALSLLFVGTTAGDTVADLRYLAVGYVAVGVLAAVAATRSPIAFALLAVTAGVATVAAVAGVATHADDHPNAPLQELADAVAAIDPAVPGYSGYWTAHIVTYHADRPGVEVLPLACRAGRSTRFEWLTDLGRFDRPDPGSGSLIVVDRDPARRLSCSPDELVAQFGPPDRTVVVSPELELWVWTAAIGPELER